MVHASGHHMTVVTEPLPDAVARIAAIKGPPTAVRRLSKFSTLSHRWWRV